MSHIRGQGRRPVRQVPSLFDQALNSDSGEQHPELSEKFKNMPPSLPLEHGSQNPSALLNRSIRSYVRESERLSSESTGENDFMSEIPTSHELFSSVLPENFEVVNNVNEPWADVTTYLKTHYKLLREDSIRPLREAITTFIKNPSMNEDQDITIYEKVHVLGFTFTHQGIAARVSFTTARTGKKIVWEHSKRLTSGSMVALSPASDNFKSACIIAIVAARPLEGVTATPPEIDLFFARPEEIEIDPQTEFVMIESRTGYFEATRHVMKALQKLNTESFPLSSNIVNLDKNINSPAYLRSASEVDLSILDQNLSPTDILNNWPDEPAGSLDLSQWSALHRILTKELSIVQGPPGTGKTFVSIAALKVLLANKIRGDPPIIVAAHTNHALDQLLRHISAFEPNYIRLGGRSMDNEIKRRTLFEIRQKSKAPPVKGGLLLGSIAELKSLTTRMIATLEPLITRQDGRPAFLNADLFEKFGLLKSSQVESLKAGAARWVEDADDPKDPLLLWLDKAIGPFEIKYQDGDFGFEDETESQTDQEYEQVKELEAELGVEEEQFELLRGVFKQVSDGYMVARGAVHSSAVAQKYLDNNNDLWSIPQAMRGAVYSFLQKKAKEIILDVFRAQAKQYAQVCQNVKIGKWERDAIILKGSNIIGMTTTGLSKYRALVAGVNPRIILVEEAAEVLEGPIAVACLESLEHLILIGDHQQLQPSTSVTQLARPPYNLHVSMFERLVMNQVPFTTLTRQRRMDPEFRELLSPIYKTLEDHICVLDRPTAPGCLHKSWLFSHIWPESTDSSFSKRNEQEAHMIAKFFNYLVLNGIPIHAITVLVFYNAQRKLILRELRKNNRLAASYLNVATVDSYQGEENSVVLLSLVRSTTDSNRSIGFCGVPNRVCVALSRARLGFYIFGNGSQLFEASQLWREILTIMISGQKRVGYHLPLRCRNHGKEIQVKDPQDFENLNGGCDLKCTGLLDCGHPCPHKCHPYEHSDILCPQKCEKPLKCGHKCQGLCGDASCICLCNEFARLSVAEDPHLSTHVNTKGFGNTLTTSSKPWNDRQKIITKNPAPVRRTPSPPKQIYHAPPVVAAISKSKTPERWRTYAAGGVLHDDQKRLQALKERESQNKAVVRRQSQQNLMDIDHERQNATSWVDEGPTGVISEKTRRIEDGNGGYRMRYEHEYVPASQHARVEKHNIDGAASSMASEVEDLIEL